MGQLGTTFGSLWDHFGIFLAYECHFGLLWGDFGTTLRFLLAYGGDFEVTLLLGQFGTTLRFLLACECDFGLLWGRFGIIWGDFRSAFKVLEGQAEVASSTLEGLWGTFAYI